MATVTPPRPDRKKKNKKKRPQFDFGTARGKSEGPESAIRTASFDRWAKHLLQRKAPQRLEKLLGCKKSTPLLWALPDDLTDVENLRAISRPLSKPKKSESIAERMEYLQVWLQEANRRHEDPQFALESLAWCHAMPDLASYVGHDLWWQLLDELISISARFSMAPSEETPWVSQLLAAELPLTLGYLFPELSECQRLANGAIPVMTEGLDLLLDGQGMPSAQWWGLMRPLLAGWTRSGHLIKQMGGLKLSSLAWENFEWLLRHVLRTTNVDTRQSLRHQDALDRSGFAELIAAACDLSEDRQDDALAMFVLAEAGVKHAKKPPEKRLPEDPSYQSDWAEAAVLQPDWSPQGPRLTFLYHEREVQAELVNHGQVLFSGAWTSQLRIEEEEVTIQSPWETNCWFSDRDVDYLEIEATLSNGWTIQRQFLMAREDQFFFTADAILGERPARIEYESLVPINKAVQFCPADETHEGFLNGRKQLALVLPLALPEWRSGQAGGSLAQEGNQLKMRLKRDACRLYVPWFFDLHRRRMRQALTWRQLTVGDQLEVVRPHDAVGYRVQVGLEQWLFYRSLTPPANRTVLGQNLSTECLVARFLSNGDVETLLEIQ